MCIDNHKWSDRQILFTTCINSVYFNIISHGFLFISRSFYRRGRKNNFLFAERTSAMWPLKSERGLKEGSLIQRLFLLPKPTLNTTDKSSSCPKTLLNITYYLKKLIQKKTWSQKPFLQGKWLDWLWLQKQNTTFPGRQPKSLLLHCCQDIFWLKVFWGNRFSCFGFSSEYT